MSTEQPLSLEELEAFFNTVALPKELRLHKAILISDVPLFVKGHLAVLKSKGIGIGGFYEHLLQARELILQSQAMGNPEGE
ncbi:hypothetical protein GA0116948_103166 [Chitinophaga costaii]|uniref:DUF6965 domain-containing protein n=1 Tax=Chitinophaga costaii TaxID=1335309 RepID=A0A1C4BMJ5_9BACT|nr:hypothetical protein [Chitinophaga costaii]PUZ27551.1 hypothetical protein DCM91_04815 [Chitinophaga costaii]SCC07964.1 hypothetical protein GA0116948_103166 [Chitinophaga costaii]